MVEATAQQRASQALQWLGAPDNWVAPSAHDHDVVIVGGGQSGIAIAFALRRAGIQRVWVIDAAREDQAGIWSSIARMRTLRTPKDMPGLEQGIAELSFRAYYTHLHGAAAYAALGRIPTADWRDYLLWYRGVVGVQVAWQHHLTHVEGADAGLALHISTPQGTQRITTRKLVLATGLAGSGGPCIPAVIAAAVPHHLRTHTAQHIDFAALRGKRLGVVGTAASAFDAASVALENGAAQVYQLSRSTSIMSPQDNSLTGGYAPPQSFFVDYPDEFKFRLIDEGRPRGNAPEDTVKRALSHPNIEVLFAVDFNTLHTDDVGIHLQHQGREVVFDHLLLGTGYRTDLRLRPELTLVAQHALLWRDRLGAIGAGTSDWLDVPYVGTGLELQDGPQQLAPWVRHIHVYNFAAFLNHGLHVGDIGSAVIGIPRLVNALTRSFYQADAAYFQARSMRQLSLQPASPPA